MQLPAEKLAKQLVRSYRSDGGVNARSRNTTGQSRSVLPTRYAVSQLLLELEELCFPGFAIEADLTTENLSAITAARIARLLPRMCTLVELDLDLQLGQAPSKNGNQNRAQKFTSRVLARLPQLRAMLMFDVQALLDGDPAARTREEIILAYPGIRAVVGHRLSHLFWNAGVRLLARMLSEDVHSRTGIDIHPGAVIGKSFYIDHGTGVVVGETTIIGNHVKLYQGVSLGALSVSRRLQDHKRHPTIEDHVTIYAGATILGGDTVVGHHSVIGGNVWLTKSVPAYSVVEQESVVRVGRRRALKPSRGNA
jgi:serine O-acetyltransferase